MPLNSALVGATTEPVIHQVDARWLMAYAASLGDYNPCYLDTHATPNVIAHPVFPVCLEWPVILNTREFSRGQNPTASLSDEESRRGVHAAHDLHLLQPIHAGDELSTQATMTEIKSIRPGAAYTMRLDSTNTATGELVARTYQLGIYRGVDVVGGNVTGEMPAPLPALATANQLVNGSNFRLPISTGAAHTYTECAHIWNPIHTDKAFALQAGLPDIILHGTATLAMAVGKIVDEFANSQPQRIRRLGGRFSAMVLMPSTITLQTYQQDNIVSYQVLNAAGELAISSGFVELK